MILRLAKTSSWHARSVALNLRMNLAALCVEDADGARRPVNVRDERNCADRVPSVGGEFAKDVGPPVEKLVSVLHARSVTSAPRRGRCAGAAG